MNKTAQFAAGDNSLNLALHAFFSEYRDALEHSADLLAGSHGRNLVDAITDRLSLEPVPSRRTRKKLQLLVDLLELKDIHDFEHRVSDCVAHLDPASPVLEEIGLLADRLKSTLGASLADF